MHPAADEIGDGEQSVSLSDGLQEVMPSRICLGQEDGAKVDVENQGAIAAAVN